MITLININGDTPRFAPQLTYTRDQSQRELNIDPKFYLESPQHKYFVALFFSLEIYVGRQKIIAKIQVKDNQGFN